MLHGGTDYTHALSRSIRGLGDSTNQSMADGSSDGTVTAEEYAASHPTAPVMSTTYDSYRGSNSSPDDDLKPGKTKYTKSTLKIHSSPSTTSSVLGSYTCNAPVICSTNNDISSDWSMVIYKGKVGFCFSKFLSDTKSPAAPTKQPSSSITKKSKTVPGGESKNDQDKAETEIPVLTTAWLSQNQIIGISVGATALVGLMVFIHLHNKHQRELHAQVA